MTKHFNIFKFTSLPPGINQKNFVKVNCKFHDPGAGFFVLGAVKVSHIVKMPTLVNGGAVG